MIHNAPHAFAGSTAKIKPGIKHPQFEDFGGSEFHLEDWWDRVSGESWMFCDGNMACMIYGMRSGMAHLPTDNEVVYGKVGGLGHLLHISELDFE
ncbi:MAG: hypothetical protein M0R32_08270 [Candidatus Cloacimonetes bacterium]|jgi:hypothetical protein|nr:hypothetical protein [Candidatus Cloacimonadota bacterium]